MAGVSLKCGDCGALLRSVEEAQEHAELTSHSNFSESTEAVLNLVCTACGKPCRSKTVFYSLTDVLNSAIIWNFCSLSPIVGLDFWDFFFPFGAMD